MSNALRFIALLFALSACRLSASGAGDGGTAGDAGASAALDGGSDGGAPFDAGILVDGGASPDGGAGGPTDGGYSDAGLPDGGGPALGLYAGASCTCDNGGPPAIDSFEQWLGSPVSYADDYSATDSWANWEFPGWQSTGWQAWKSQDPARRLIYAPGMGVVQDIDGGATGAYDGDWQALGQSLVAAGMDDAIIRIAHEFSGNWYWYQPEGQQAQFIAYWQHIVTAMRSVSGQHFQFSWNPALGVSYQGGRPFDCETAYPGDAYVDYIGPDVYDSVWGVYPTSGPITQAMQDQAWNTLLAGDHGLAWFVAFAAQHQKPIAVPEFGVWAEGSSHGGGDDPSFIQRFHDWSVQNQVAIVVYFNFGANQIWPSSVNGFPNSLALFQQLY
ncbi:MAG: glycoside hydrolase family 26 protein [Deltaproteobacteria bacterium]